MPELDIKDKEIQECILNGWDRGLTISHMAVNLGVSDKGVAKILLMCQRINNYAYGHVCNGHGIRNKPEYIKHLNTLGSANLKLRDAIVVSWAGDYSVKTITYQLGISVSDIVHSLWLTDEITKEDCDILSNNPELSKSMLHQYKEADAKKLGLGLGKMPKFREEDSRNSRSSTVTYPENLPTSETAMAINTHDLKITTVQFLRGRSIDSYTENDLIRIIEEAERDIIEAEKIKNKPAFLKETIKTMNEDLVELINYLDSRWASNQEESK